MGAYGSRPGGDFGNGAGPAVPPIGHAITPMNGDTTSTPIG